MGTINQVVRRKSYKKSVLHFFCAIQTSDGGMEKKRRMERAVESGGFVVFLVLPVLWRSAFQAHRRQCYFPGTSYPVTIAALSSAFRAQK